MILCRSKYFTYQLFKTLSPSMTTKKLYNPLCLWWLLEDDHDIINIHTFLSFFVKRWCVTLHFFFNFPNTQPPMMWNMVFITTNWKECNNHAIWIQDYNDMAPQNLHILLSCLKCWWNISFLFVSAISCISSYNL